MDDISTTLTGTVRLTTNHWLAPLKGPFTEVLAWPIQFRDKRRTADGEMFPKLTIVREGHEITVERETGGIGEFEPATGRLDLTIELRVEHELGPVGVTLKLTTESVTPPAGGPALNGSRVADGTGTVTLVAAAIFDPGDVLLSGKECKVTIEGVFDPKPR